MLAASVLTDEPDARQRAADSRCREHAQLLAGLGMVISAANSVTLCARGLHTTLDRARQSPRLHFAGRSLAARRAVILSTPGGDVIGRRRLDATSGLAQLGIRISGTTTSISPAAACAAGAIASQRHRHRKYPDGRHACPGRADFNACEPRAGPRQSAHQNGRTNYRTGHQPPRSRRVKTLRGARHRVGPDYIEIGSVRGAATTGALTTELPDATTGDAARWPAVSLGAWPTAG